MSIPATTNFAAPDPNIPFTDITDLVTLFNTLVATVLPNDLTPYIIGDTIPAVDDQDKAWVKLDSSGRPLGTFVFYSGAWVREAPPVGARLGYFSGDPTGAFDVTGLGLPDTDYFGWALANGNNGTANLTDRFIIVGQVDNSDITGYSGGVWRTNINGSAENTGGVADITLDGTNTYRPAFSRIAFDHMKADGNARDPTGALWGDLGGGDDTTLIAADAGNLTPPAIPTVPPFFALAFIAWIGYPPL